MVHHLSKDDCQMFSSVYPPHPYIKILSKVSPTAIKTYYRLWDLKDDKNNVYIFQDEILKHISQDKYKFLRDLAAINDEGLLSWSLENEGSRKVYSIELTGWQDEFDDELDLE